MSIEKDDETGRTHLRFQAEEARPRSSCSSRHRPSRHLRSPGGPSNPAAAGSYPCAGAAGDGGGGGADPAAILADHLHGRRIGRRPFHPDVRIRRRRRHHRPRSSLVRLLMAKDLLHVNLL